MSTVRRIQETGAADPFHMGDRIRKAREHTGMNRQEFAHAVGIHRETLAKYEDSGENVKRPALLSIAMSSGVRLEWLESGKLPWLNEDPHSATETKNAPRPKPGGGVVGPAGIEPTTITVVSGHLAPVTPIRKAS